MRRIFVVLILWFLFDLFAFDAVKTASIGLPDVWINSIHVAYWLIDIVLLGIIFYMVAKGKFAKGPNKKMNWLMALVMLSIIPKLFISLFLIAEDIFRVIYSFIDNSERDSFLITRNILWSRFVLLLTLIPVIGIIYGVWKGKYAYKVQKIKLSFDNLPDAFNGFKITQLSDIHSGSFDNKEAVERGIQLANEQKSDVIFFTGDLVNNRADEMNEWISTFAKLSAPMGKFSILGNHDYGDYIPWESAEAKANNLQRLKEVHREIGFKLLLNENVKLEKNGQSISLIGVENWGKRGFVKHGDLNKALEGTSNDEFKILLSHDPSHWQAQVLEHKSNIQLTLSGHTHGMQFGFELFGFKWSPIKYIYRQWAGAYQQNGKYIYVNRGFGFLGFPGRVGIMPEITVIELVKGKF